MPNFMSINFLEDIKSMNVTGNNLFINGYSYPIIQQNGQRAVGPCNILGLDHLKPNEFENEIFLDKIPCTWTEGVLMRFMMQADVVYFMRFLINFSGQSRGTAYVQFLKTSSREQVIEKLNKLFKENHLRIVARVSYNFRRLRIGNILDTVSEDKILKIFEHCGCVEWCHLIGEQTKSYFLTFGNNRDACLARRFLLSRSEIFGPSVYVVWLDKPKRKI